jgi:surfactin synthase thioesterase subunit
MPQTSTRNVWLPRRPSADVSGRVFLIPYSGCGASLYRAWPRRRENVEFLPVEPPGRETRFAEPTFDSYPDLARSMAVGLAPHLDVPFALFGHCGSALAAGELVVELARTGAPTPTRLFVSSEVAPQDGPVGRYLSMDDGELRTELGELIAASGGLVTDDLVDLQLSVLRADLEATKRYVMSQAPQLPCPITAIGWAEDAEVPHETMGGWAKCGDTTFVVLPGQHRRFTEAPAELLDLLCAGVRPIDAQGYPDARRGRGDA